MPDGASLLKAPAREARCVVWHERGAELKPELLAALARPGFSVVRCDDEFTAVALVCRAARDARHAQPAPLLILLLVDPLRLETPVAVVESVARHAPGVVVWMYDLTSSPQLRTVRATDIAVWKRAELTPKPPLAEQTPSITVKATVPAAPSAPTAVPSSEPLTTAGQAMTPLEPPSIEVPPIGPLGPAHRLLTDDELAMLLDIETPPPDHLKGL